MTLSSMNNTCHQIYARFTMEETAEIISGRLGRFVVKQAIHQVSSAIGTKMSKLPQSYTLSKHCSLDNIQATCKSQCKHLA